MQIANGTTDVTTYFVLRDSTNHAPKTDVTITDIDLYYCEQGAAMAAKVDATALAAADSAHDDNKAFHVGQGLYRIDWPDTCFDGGVGKVCNLIVVCTGVDTTFLEVELVGVAQTGDSFARIGAAGASLSAVPWNAAWDAEVESEVADAMAVTLADSIPADGSRPSLLQAAYMIVQYLYERAVSGTTVTVNKVDGSTPLLTLTLSDGTNPTSITRAS